MFKKSIAIILAITLAITFHSTFIHASLKYSTLLPFESPAIFNKNKVVESFGHTFTVNNYKEYQLGDEWGKLPVDIEKLNEAALVYKRAAMATARLGGGTAFYLGEFNGQYIMATNYHVFNNGDNCEFLTAHFTASKVKATCLKHLGAWTDIDLALFTVKFSSEEDKNKMAEYAENFAFYDSLKKGTPLLTVGHGVANNPSRVLVANQDSDCKVFSQDEEYRFMADPDEFNPGPYKAWSFSNGCEVSHGDSGSAMVDRTSGKVVGIIWTGRIPKNEKVQSTAFLDEVFAKQTQEVWEELSYAVPAQKIGDHLVTLLNENKLDENTAPLIRALLGL